MELTQYGGLEEDFRSAPRLDQEEGDVSLILGKQTSLAAALIVTKTFPPNATVRHTTAGTIRSASFVVNHTPTRGNPLHVSVLPAAGPQGPQEWDEGVASPSIGASLILIPGRCDVMGKRALMPELSNLAWAPLAHLDEVEIFDQHNGVPTLGTIRTGDEIHLFWRVIGYTGEISAWLYVPLDAEGETHLDVDDGTDLLDGVVFGRVRPCYGAIGVADRNRLIFEREWRIPERLGAATILRPFLEFISESLVLAIREDLSPTRRQAMERASEAVRQLVDA